MHYLIAVFLHFIIGVDIFFALVLLGKCDEIWVFGERMSEGMEREIAKARKRNMPIRYFNSRCVEESADE